MVFIHKTMKAQTCRRYTVTNLKTGEKREFVGGGEARRKARELEDDWYDQGVEYTSEPVTIRKQEAKK